MLRALFNTRLARPITPEFEQIQDAYLTEVLAQKENNDSQRSNATF